MGLWTEGENRKEDEMKDKAEQKPMSKAMFTRRMRAIRNRGTDDVERNHADADDLMVEALRSLGYSKGCDAYEVMEKWYA